MMEALHRRVAKLVLRKGRKTGRNREDKCSPPSSHLTSQDMESKTSQDMESKTSQDMTIQPVTHLDSSSPISLPLTNTEGDVESMSDLEFLKTGDVSWDKHSSLVQEVFQNDLIFDKIVQFLMADDEVKQQIKTINSCKLVQRQWLEMINNALQKSPPNWFKIKLDYFAGKKRTEKFIETFENCPDRRIPPFTLNFRFNYRRCGPFSESIYCNMLDWIQQYGAGMVEINLHVDSRNGLFYPNPNIPEAILYPVNVGFLHLPKLKRLTVHIFSDSATIHKIVYEQVKLLLDPILTGCEYLKEFSLLVNSPMHSDNMIIPLKLEIFKLPPTLSTVHFQFELRRGVLAQRLMENPLPNLTVLKINGGSTEPSIANELNRVLNKFSNKLKHLEFEISDNWKTSESNSQVTLVPPAMKSLEVFKFNAKRIELSVPVSTNLDSHFPALKKILLYYQPYEILQNWLHNAKHGSVQEALFYVYPNELNEFEGKDSQLVQQMKRIKCAFPNIVKLRVETCYTGQFSLVKFICQEIRQLQELQIRVKNCPENRSQESFESIFLGLSPNEELEVLNARINDWNIFTRKNMPGLGELLLWFVNSYKWYRSRLGWNLEKKLKIEGKEDYDWD